MGQASWTAGPSGPRDNFHDWADTASGSQLSIVAAQLAAQDDKVPVGRAARLGVAAAGLARELAASRREIAVLKRENTALRSRLEGRARDG
jgi:hypothetical protein